MKGWQAGLAFAASVAAGAGLWLGFAHSPAERPAVSVAGREPAAAAAPATMPQPASAGADDIAPPSLEASGISQAISGPGPASDSPPHVFEIAQQGSALDAAFASVPYVSRASPGGAVLYAIVFRDCRECLAMKLREMPAFDVAGFDVRWIVYARRDEAGEQRSTPRERSLVAELAESREFALFDSWFSGLEADYLGSDVPASADAVPERKAHVERGRALIDRLAQIALANGQQLAMPALFWKTGDRWFAYAGYDPATFPEVRRAFGLPVLPAPAAQQ